MRKVDVFILSGFLGSGKTTLLRQLLQEEKEHGRNVGVIMNEAGETAVDSEVLPNEVPLAELLNGCVCCTIQGQLEGQLEEMISSYTLDAIYIETTGIAHPIEVLDGCITPSLSGRITVRSIITVVNSKLLLELDSLSNRAQKLFLEQIRHGDLLLLNKEDLLTEDEKANTLMKVQMLNEGAKTILTTQARVPLSYILTQTRSRTASHEPTHMHHHLHIETFSYHEECAFNGAKLESFLKSLPQSVYRVKGYVRLQGNDQLYSLQYAYGMPLLMPVELQAKPSLVFIGENLQPQILEQGLNSAI
ncbi:GTP-binding protein [Priestia filamentosa]|uniref:CobW family GTP-binding protein n=1 Tax=Priestia filamentosa TaxID=1402861 RepID=UPI002E20F3BB|nr:GTP-binding protein [Priestia filamentosa]